MGGPRRSWFLAPRAPNFDCSPDGYIGLGSIIKDPFRPDEPIIRKIPPPLPDGIEVERTYKTDWEELKETAKKGKLGIWAQFLQLVSIEDASVNWTKTRSDAFKFQSLDIEKFLPPIDFIQSQMALPEIKQYVNSGSTRHNVYMITAIMIARGAAVKQARGDEGGFHFKIGADLTAAGAPGTTLGPDVGLSASSKHEILVGGSSDIVFAYRLSKIQYKRKSIFSSERETDPTDSLYEPQKGTAFDNDTTNVDQPTDVIDVDSVDIRDGDVSSHELGLDDGVATTNEVDHEHCECILPE